MTTETTDPAPTPVTPAVVPAAAAPAAAPKQMSLLGEAGASKEDPKSPSAGAPSAPARVAEPVKDPKADVSAGGETAKVPEAKTGDEAKGEPAKATKDAPADIEIELPEGVKQDDALMTGFKTVAKEFGLTSVQAQKIADLQFAAQKTAEASAMQRRDDMGEKFKKQVTDDKELGGDNLTATKNLVAKAMRSSMVSQELRELLGGDPILGNHPAIVRLFARMGAAIGEDDVAGTVASGAPAAAAPAPKEFRDRIFYNHAKSKR